MDTFRPLGDQGGWARKGWVYEASRASHAHMCEVTSLWRACSVLPTSCCLIRGAGWGAMELLLALLDACVGEQVALQPQSVCFRKSPPDCTTIIILMLLPCVCMCTYLCTRVETRDEHRLSSSNCSPHYCSRRQGLLLNLEVVDLDNLATQFAPGPLSSPDRHWDYRRAAASSQL